MDCHAEYCIFPTKAFFKATAKNVDYFPLEALNHLETYMTQMAHEFERPKRIIRIHADITDGPIPSLSFNPENLQLSYNWREMFTIFYGEQRLYHKLLDTWAKEHKDGVLNLEI